MPTLRLHDVVRIPPQWGHHVAINVIHTYARAVSHESCPALSRQAEHTYARVFQSAECSIPPHNLGSGSYLRCGHRHRVRSAETAQSQTPCFQHQKKQGWDRLPITWSTRQIRYTGSHSPGINSDAGADRHTLVADVPLIALLRSTRAVGDIDSAYSPSSDRLGL
jgi:hypothetical protein